MQMRNEVSIEEDDRRLMVRAKRVAITTAISSLIGTVSFFVFLGVHATNGKSLNENMTSMLIGGIVFGVIPLVLSAIIISGFVAIVEFATGFFRPKRNLLWLFIAVCLVIPLLLPFFKVDQPGAYYEGMSVVFIMYGFATALCWWWMLPAKLVADPIDHESTSNA
jgi:hypothetical protein